MAHREELRPKAQFIGVSRGRHGLVASYVKPKTEFSMTLRDMRIHTFDDLTSFYVCEDEAVAHTAVAALRISAPAKIQTRAPGTYNVRHANFVRFIRPLFSVVDQARHERIVRLFWGLSLHRETRLAIAAARLLASDKANHSADWCAFAGKVAPNRRIVFLTLLAETGLGRTAFSDGVGDFFREIENLALRRNYAAWIFMGSKAILGGIDRNYTLAGMRLAHEFSPNHTFHWLRDCADFDAQGLQICLARVRNSTGFYPALPLTVWRHSPDLPGLTRLIAQVEWRRLKPNHALQLLRCMYELAYDDLEQHKITAKWRVFMRFFPEMLRVIYTTPLTYRRKAIDLFGDFYWYFDKPRQLEKYHADFLAFTQRVCRPPFSRENNLGSVWCVLQKNGSLTRATGLLRLEKFCRSKNTAWLVRRGIHGFLRISPEYAAELLATGNPRLLAIAKLLGCLPRKQRFDVLLAMKNCSLFSITITPQNLAETLRIIDGHRSAAIQNPVPRRLRAFTRGEIRLNARAISGHTRELEAKLFHFRLHVLEQRIIESVRRHYNFSSESRYDHALLFANLISENRKALKKFLAAHAAGHTDYLAGHPATQLWLKKAPAFNREVWRDGIELAVPDEAAGEIRLMVERDPLEKLKLGTYVGSCLGLGGSFMYSAAAVVLDINKHVVYARLKTGQVVARQLVCISEQGKLVPFSVYPVGATEAMQAHFAEFDRRFAEALAIPCHDANSAEDYKIANILSQDWWDDCAWDLEAQ